LAALLELLQEQRGIRVPQELEHTLLVAT